MGGATAGLSEKVTGWRSRRLRSLLGAAAGSPRLGAGFIPAAREDCSARREPMVDRVCIGVQARTTDVTRSGDEASPITTMGGGTRSHGGRSITTAAPANIGATTVLSAGGSVPEGITAACVTTAATDGRIRSSGPFVSRRRELRGCRSCSVLLAVRTASRSLSYPRCDLAELDVERTGGATPGS